jgi:ketosteroid isomerase-like protein
MATPTGSLTGEPPPASWPRVQHDWYNAALNRDVAGWRGCLSDDARSIGMDGKLTTGADAVVDAMRAYYENVRPIERIDAWIASADGDHFVWHGAIEPNTPNETKWCTVCTVRGGLIDELRFFGDQAVLARLWGRP